MEGLNTSLADIGAAQDLADEIYAINDNADASAYELELMDQLLSQLQDLCTSCSRCSILLQILTSLAPHCQARGTMLSIF